MRYQKPLHKRFVAMQQKFNNLFSTYVNNFSFSRLLPYVSLTSGMALVGCYIAVNKPLSFVFPVFLLMWLRFGIGAIAMWGWLKKPADEPSITRRTHYLLFAEAVFGVLLFTLFSIIGIHLTSATAASVIMSAIPAVVALMGRFWLHEQLTKRTILSIICAVLGIVLLTLSKSNAVTASSTSATDYRTWLGYGSLLLAVLCEASYSILGKQLTAHLGAKRIAAMVNVWGLVLSTPLGIYFAWNFAFANVRIVHWGLLLFYSLASGMISVWLWMTGLRYVPAAQAGVFTVFLPISTAVTGVVFLQERLNNMQWLALAIALASVLLATVPVSFKRSR